VLVTKDDCDLYSSSLSGVRPLLEMMEWFPAGFPDATVADRIVGGCAARIFVHLKASVVFSEKSSVEAERILSAAGIEHDSLRTVPEIRNRDDTDICPFERLSREYTDVRELVRQMRRKLEQLRA